MEGAQRAAHTLQIMLSRYQQQEERCVDELSKLLRQAVVFEAACLANEQFEAQTTFRAAEKVSKDKDLEAFVATLLHKGAAGNDDGSAPDAGAALLGVVSRSLGLPLPPTPPPPPSAHKAMKHTPTPTPTTTAAAAGPAVVLQPHDLPNLSAPAPNVVPARYVLRLLRGAPLTSPVPSPPPSTAALPSAPAPPATDPPPSVAPLALRSPIAAACASATVTMTAMAPQPKSPIPVAVARASPVLGAGTRRPAVVDEDDEDEEEEEDDGEEDDGRAVVTRSPLPQQSKQPLPARSLKALVQARHDKQQWASGATVEVEEVEAEEGGKEYVL